MVEACLYSLKVTTVRPYSLEVIEVSPHSLKVTTVSYYSPEVIAVSPYSHEENCSQSLQLYGVYSQS